MAKGEPPKCYECHKVITFSDQFIGKNGRKIPLDPETLTPHDCPMRNEKAIPTTEFLEKTYPKEKDDHGNEQIWSNETLKIRNSDNTGTDDLIPKYVDHTVARPSKVKIFHAENSDLVELAYNEFLKNKTFQWTRAQLGAKGNEFAIALYYEETKQ